MCGSQRSSRAAISSSGAPSVTWVSRACAASTQAWAAAISWGRAPGATHPGAPGPGSGRSRPGRRRLGVCLVQRQQQGAGLYLVALGDSGRLDTAGGREAQ
ncbi:MAG: hypothetical protein H6649_09515 [Caldilineae bacterium]|nr:hypothetical protein [Caldilineae bacterium]